MDLKEIWEKSCMNMIAIHFMHYGTLKEYHLLNS